MIGYEFEDENKATNFIDLKISKMRFVWKDQYNGKYDNINDFDKSSNYNNNNYSNDDNNNNDDDDDSNYNDNDNNNNGNNENSKDKKR